MTKNERMQIIDNRFKDVTEKSWTWERLTKEEKDSFLSLHFDRIKSTRNIAETIDIYELIYHAFLLGAGCKFVGWREKEETPLF